jgi:hypothetical protein
MENHIKSGNYAACGLEPSPTGPNGLAMGINGSRALANGSANSDLMSSHSLLPSSKAR